MDLFQQDIADIIFDHSHLQFFSVVIYVYIYIYTDRLLEKSVFCLIMVSPCWSCLFPFLVIWFLQSLVVFQSKQHDFTPKGSSEKGESQGYVTEILLGEVVQHVNFVVKPSPTFTNLLAI